MKTICNPLNIRYLYQYITENGKASVSRESADPSVRLYKDTYYLFASMSRGFFYSDDLVSWSYKETPELPPTDYAPDITIIDGWFYVCASSATHNAFYRTKDPINERFEKIPTDMVFWDPNLFQDDDGRVYFYWGCSDRTPIWGVELDRETMKPIGEKAALIAGNPDEHGWERFAENNDLRLQEKKPGKTGAPFIEGAWMTKHNGTYYLQYAGPGTEYNVYSDGCYTSKNPLGPYTYAIHNPPSSKPGGFITGAGHGSTFCDKYGNWWHVATMRISVNHDFERRIGIFPAEFDEDGIFCVNQNFADYPFIIPEKKVNIWHDTFPGYMLLSYKKNVLASSSAPNYGPENAVNEDIRNYWVAGDTEPGQFICADLGKAMTVHAIQLNLGDDKIPFAESFKNKLVAGDYSKRYIDADFDAAEYTIESSVDGKTWQTLKDSRGSGDDHTHEYLFFEAPLQVRYVRATGYKMPYNAPFTVSGLRVFGKGDGEKPDKVTTATAKRVSPLDAQINWNASKGADGYNVRYGIQPDKLYSSWLVYEKTELNLGLLNKGVNYFVRVDAFNENGITEGEVVETSCCGY